MKTKIQTESSDERQLYRKLNQIKRKLELLNESMKNTQIQRTLFSEHSHTGKSCKLHQNLQHFILFVAEGIFVFLFGA